MRRWTETTKWVDRWFRRLPPASKIFYFYLIDNCDESGVWERDFDRFAFESRLAAPGELGCDPGDMTEEELVDSLGNRIQVLPDDKILVLKFLPYQQPKGLNMNVPLHQKIQGRLNLHGLRYDQGSVSLDGDTPGGSHDPPPDPPREGLVSVSVSVPVNKGESEGKEETLPEALDFPEFREAWKEFKTYRSAEKKKKLTKLGATRALNLLAKTPDKAIEAIEYSMTHGYLGADPEWLNSTRNGRPQTQTIDRNYANALDC